MYWFFAALDIALRIAAFRRTQHRVFAWYLAFTIPGELICFWLGWIHQDPSSAYYHFWSWYECLSLLGLAGVAAEAVNFQVRGGAIVAREAHNLLVAGSNPVSATKLFRPDIPLTKRWRSAEFQPFDVKGKVINRFWLRVRPGQSRSYANGQLHTRRKHPSVKNHQKGAGVLKWISAPIVLTAVALLILHHSNPWPGFWLSPAMQSIFAANLCLGLLVISACRWTLHGAILCAWCLFTAALYSGAMLDPRHVGLAGELLNCVAFGAWSVKMGDYGLLFRPGGGTR